MRIVMLALAEKIGHQPVWALQGGSDPKVTGPMVKYFQDVRKLLTSDSRRDFSHGEDLFLNWTDAAEDLASGLVDGDCIWQASHVYFFGIPEEVAPKFARDGVGNEVCYWIDKDGEVKFADYIPLEEVYQHSW
jgi:hypothetical protein